MTRFGQALVENASFRYSVQPLQTPTPQNAMADLPFDQAALKNLLALVTKGVSKDKLGGAGDLIGSLLGGSSSGGGLGGLASLAGGLLGGAKGGADDLLAKLASAVKSVLGSGSLGAQVGDVFKSRIFDGNSVAAVAKQFGIAEGTVNEFTDKAVAAVRDQFLKSV